jgi:hypothetical protein
MEDKLDTDQQMVIQYEPRSRRRVDKNQYILFGASGATEEAEFFLVLQ